tara:strand:- start:1355 stop:1534 length:180 start_codon:yes stop_codon:yes gene_type:complete
MDRYRVELSLNIWCDSDDKAKQIAEDICKKQKKKFDNRCQITKLYNSPFAVLKEKEIIL